MVNKIVQMKKAGEKFQTMDILPPGVVLRSLITRWYMSQDPTNDSSVFGETKALCYQAFIIGGKSDNDSSIFGETKALHYWAVVEISAEM